MAADIISRRFDLEFLIDVVGVLGLSAGLETGSEEVRLTAEGEGDGAKGSTVGDGVGIGD